MKPKPQQQLGRCIVSLHHPQIHDPGHQYLWFQSVLDHYGLYPEQIDCTFANGLCIYYVTGPRDDVYRFAQLINTEEGNFRGATIKHMGSYS